MSNISGPAVITQTLSTIPEAAAPEAAPETSAVVPPVAPSEAASGAAAKGPDRSLELARKFESVAQRESRARKYEREARERAATIEAREKKLAERERELEDALGDPVGHMLKIGKDPLEVAQRYAKPESPEEKRIRQLEERIAKDDQEKKDAQEKWEKERAEQEHRTIMSGFVRGITEKECPNLTALYEARQVPDLLSDMLQRPMDPRDPESPTMMEAFVAKHRRNPTDKELREALEYEATDRATKILARNRAAAASSSAQPGDGAPTQDSAKTEGGPSGISNQHAAVTASGKKRPPTIEERRKQSRKQLTAALEAEGNDDR